MNDALNAAKSAINDGVLRTINERLGLGLKQAGSEYGVIYAVDPNGLRYAVVCYDGPVIGIKYVRGIVRQRRPHTRFRFLPAGEASKGAVQVGFFNEGDFIYEVPWEEYLALQLALVGWKRIIETLSGVRAPAHLRQKISEFVALI